MKAPRMKQRNLTGLSQSGSGVNPAGSDSGTCTFTSSVPGTVPYSLPVCGARRVRMLTTKTPQVGNIGELSPPPAPGRPPGCHTARRAGR